MKAFLIAEEGSLLGTLLPLEEAEEWIIGRDPNACAHVLEDPMVSRKAALISLQNERFVIENLSTTNPISVNGDSVVDPTILEEGDLIQLGSTTFRFSLIEPKQEPVTTTLDQTTAAPNEEYEMGTLSFSNSIVSRWMIKVVSGPNNGAEFSIKEGQTYLVGKDPDTCDILFQDLSVSRQHAKILCSKDGTVSVEDLGSRNGTLLNGSLVEQTATLASQDVLAMGTSSLLLIDRQASSQTIYSPPLMTRYTDRELSKEEIEEAAKEAASLEESIKLKRNWKETFIPNRHIAIGALILLVTLSCLIGAFSLFKSTPVHVATTDERGEIQKTLKNFPSIEFSYVPNSGNLFLMGHILTDVEYQEMLYLLKAKPFIKNIDDNVIIDEYVFENINALLYKNPLWRSVILTGSQPGKFVLKGYMQTLEEFSSLNDYVNRNFPYLDKLKIEVVVENNVQTSVQALLAQKGFNGVTFQFANGEIVLSGRIEQGQEKVYNALLKELDQIPGIRHIKNFVVFTTHSSARLDVSSRFKVTGTSKLGDLNQFILINGKILSTGDLLEGMVITAINPTSVFLEKEGIKYKIDYNLQ